MRTHDKKYINGFVISLFMAITAIVISTINDKFSVLYYFGYFLLGIIFLRKHLVNKKEKDIYIISYSFLFLLSVVLIYHHQFYYNSPFDAYGDDYRFFCWGKELQVNNFFTSYSFYEKIISLIFLIFSVFKIEPNIYQVLPLNILIGSYVVVLSYRIAFKLTGVDLSKKIIFVIMLLNYSFSENVVHLYRDVYIALFSLLFIIYVNERNNFKTILMIVLTGLFRLPNAIFLIAILPIHQILLWKKNSIIKSILFGSVFLLLFSLSIAAGFKFSKYDMAKSDEIIATRILKFSSSAREAGGGLAIVNDLPTPVRFVINTYVQVIRPISIKGIFYPVRESLSHLKIINHKSIGWAITTITLVFLVGRYISGITKLVVSRDSGNLIVVLYFIVTTFTIGFLSYLDRHRVFLIPIFPLVYAFSFSPNRNKFIGFMSSRYFYKISGTLMLIITIGVSFL